MRAYAVKRTSTAVPLSQEVLGTAWSEAAELSIDIYPWFESGEKQQTTVRLLYDESAVYTQFLCDDKHIYSEHTEVNSGVCNDSCVEVFAMPRPEDEGRYFNLEMNCCGNFLLGWGRNREEITGKYVEAEVSTAYLEIAASEAGPTRQESGEDDGWWVASKIPFELLSKLAGGEIRPSSGSIWRANFYRCGGKTDDQYAVWNRVGTAEPDYHQPEYFGELVFE